MRRYSDPLFRCSSRSYSITEHTLVSYSRWAVCRYYLYSVLDYKLRWVLALAVCNAGVEIIERLCTLQKSGVPLPFSIGFLDSGIYQML